MFSVRKEGFQSSSVPASAATALTEFYTNTYLPAIRYLPVAELNADKIIAGISTNFRLVSQKAQFCMGTPPRLTGGDTDASITTLMNSATRILTSSLIRAYSATHTTWSGRGLSVTRAMIVDPSDTDLTLAVLSARNAYIGSGGHWPILISAIQTLVKNVSIGNAKTGYELLTGTPVGVGKLGQSTKPIVVTLDASGTALYGSQVGATTFGFLWGASMGTGTSGTSVTGIGTNGFTATLTGLTSGTTYYYKAWATNAAGTNYGIQKSFVYSVAPTLSAASAVVSTTNVALSCTVSNGGAPLIEKGFVYVQSNTQPSSLTKASGQIVMDISSGTSISSTLNLIAGQKYFYVAYATNSIGTTYTNIASFEAPVLGTVELVKYESTSNIKVFAKITSIGNGSYIEAGIVYSTTNATPTIADTKITVGSYTLNSEWSLVIQNPASTVHNIRSYVTTSFGTTYSTVTYAARPFAIAFSQNKYVTQVINSYNVYAITASLTFTIADQVTFNYLLVGGGGGGGGGGNDRTGGGGGGGGCLLRTVIFPKGTYTVTIGSGGGISSSGTDSVIEGPSGFTKITAMGGGAGGYAGNLPKTGGSGGGGFHGSNQSGASGTTGQGNSGGKGYDSAKSDNIYSGGGGGGQSTNGADGSAKGAGQGGTGLAVTSTNLPGFSTSIGGQTFPSSFGGGGGGGFQNLLDTTAANGSGSSGGGTGAYYIKTGSLSANATNGAQYTGGGGGGCAYNDATLYAAGSGGSGILILTVAA